MIRGAMKGCLKCTQVGGGDMFHFLGQHRFGELPPVCVRRFTEGTARERLKRR